MASSSSAPAPAPPASTARAIPQPRQAQTGFVLPWPYRLFFLTIEPLSALLGAFYAHFLPSTYLALTHLPSAPTPDYLPVSSSIVLTQLANLYLLFALNEALVLRATANLKVWRVLLVGLLIADFGHLYSVAPKGLEVYYNVGAWNKMDWGNVGFVYLGAAMRIAFLLGVGFPEKRVVKKVEGKKV